MAIINYAHSYFKTQTYTIVVLAWKISQKKKKENILRKMTTSVLNQVKNEYMHLHTHQLILKAPW